MRNKTQQQVMAEVEAVNKAMSQLENRRIRLTLLSQFQKQGVTRKNHSWYVSGNRLVVSN